MDGKLHSRLIARWATLIAMAGGVLVLAACDEDATYFYHFCGLPDEAATFEGAAENACEDDEGMDDRNCDPAIGRWTCEAQSNGCLSPDHHTPDITCIDTDTYCHGAATCTSHGTDCASYPAEAVHISCWTDYVE